MFAFGATLQALLKPSAQPRDLGRLLTLLTHSDVATRPTIDQALEQIEELVHKGRLDEKRQDSWNAVLRRIAKDQHKHWYTKALNKNRSKIEALAVGFHTNPIERSRVLAAILVQVAEAYPPRGFDLRSAIDETDHGRAVRQLAALRVAESHAGDRLYEEHAHRRSENSSA